MSYIVTNKDRMAMIEIMEKSWHVHFKSSQEKGSNYTRWDVQAVNPTDTTYYSSDGSSIVEAVADWFNKTGNVRTKPVTLQEAKEKEAEIIEFYD